ncbi:hypothetical protein EP227_07105 [bacterium]|nr:MAG: hypothetical protein EP227_07105 [bacterium]
MTIPEMLKVIRKVMRSVFTVLFFILYLFSVAVVIMFLTSTLHLLNQELFPFKKFDFMTALITISVIVVSIKVFPKMFKKYYYFMDKFTSGKVQR